VLQEATLPNILATVAAGLTVDLIMVWGPVRNPLRCARSAARSSKPCTRAPRGTALDSFAPGCPRTACAGAAAATLYPALVAVELTLLSRVAYRDQEVTGPRLRGLLALLASDLRTGCSTARLVEGLWPDEQSENPTKALQVLVSRARAQLGADVIATTPTGYRLALGEDQVDASAVLLSASASARQARAGDHEAALAHAEAGLALYEAAERADTGFDDPVSALRAERASTYRSLVRARALALSRLGRHA
jgi:Transcriptional regulatory protein, C terminal